MMTEKTISEWKCDRCNATTTTSITEEPEGWSGFDASSTPRSDEGLRIHFCATCTASYAAWLATQVPSEPEETPPGETEPLPEE